jgi:hypothetical protein
MGNKVDNKNCEAKARRQDKDDPEGSDYPRLIPQPQSGLAPPPVWGGQRNVWRQDDRSECETW